MEDKRLLTIKDMSKKLDIPESTLRFWRDKYIEFVPYVGEGRKRRYKKEALLVFQRIQELSQSQDNLTTAEIAERLSLEFAREVTIAEDGETNQNNKKATMLDIYAIQKTFEQIAATQQLIVDLVAENRELKEEVKTLSDRIDEQEQKYNERDQKLINTIRELQKQQEKNKNKKSFFQKIFGK